MIVRSHLPWPLRWAIVALMLGFSAAIAMWAFEFGKEIAGLDRNAKAELAKLRVEVAQLQADRERTQAIVNTADSLLKAERVAQARLAQQIKDIEVENLALKADLGFFERLLPTGASSAVSIRGLQVQRAAPGQLRFQLLIMQSGKKVPDFQGRYEITLLGTLADKSWNSTPPEGTKPLQMRQHLRVEGILQHPKEVLVKTVQVRVLDRSGGVRATQSAKL